MLPSLLLVLAPLFHIGQAADSPFKCTREWLQMSVDRYIYMQQTGQHGEFENLSYDLVYKENNQTKSILADLPAWPQVIDSNRSILDTTQCKTFTELIMAKQDHPYVVGTQMTLDSEGSVALIDSIVTDKGDWAFNATGYLYWSSQEDWAPIAADKRLSREELKAAADAYADRCNNVSVVVPFDTPCARLEGGAYTGRGNLSANTCDIGGLPEHTPLTDRKYVIDEVMGSVDIFLGFTGLDRTAPNNGTPDSHLFRVEERKIRYIHTVSACFVDGCGLNGTGIPSILRH